MPKVKTHRGLAKRVKVTASGKIKRKKAYHSHLLSSKTPKMKKAVKVAKVNLEEKVQQDQTDLMGIQVLMDLVQVQVEKDRLVIQEIMEM